MREEREGGREAAQLWVLSLLGEEMKRGWLTQETAQGDDYSLESGRYEKGEEIRGVEERRGVS